MSRFFTVDSRASLFSDWIIRFKCLRAFSIKSAVRFSFIPLVSEHGTNFFRFISSFLAQGHHQSPGPRGFPCPRSYHEQLPFCIEGDGPHRPSKSSEMRGEILSFFFSHPSHRPSLLSASSSSCFLLSIYHSTHTFPSSFFIDSPPPPTTILTPHSYACNILIQEITYFSFSRNIHHISSYPFTYTTGYFPTSLPTYLPTYLLTYCFNLSLYSYPLTSTLSIRYFPFPSLSS